jgi:hypothetical protein
LYNNFNSVTEPSLVKNILDKAADKTAISKEIKRVHQVFDQKSINGRHRAFIKGDAAIPIYL